mgnify:FL=1
MCCGGHVVLELAACVCLSRLLYSADAVLVGHLLGPVLSWELIFLGGQELQFGSILQEHRVSILVREYHRG